MARTAETGAFTSLAFSVSTFRPCTPLSGPYIPSGVRQTFVCGSTRRAGPSVWPLEDKPHILSDHVRGNPVVFRTCWVDLSVDQQLEKRLGDVKPEPQGLPFPRNALEVDLIYDTPIPVRGGLGKKSNTIPPRSHTVSCKTHIRLFGS